MAEGEGAAAAAALHEGLSMAWELGYDLGILDSIAVLADVALRSGRPERAVRLLGAVHALAEARGMVKLPHHLLYQVTQDEARQTLGEVAVARAWSAGETLSLEQGVLEAMNQADLLLA